MIFIYILIATKDDFHSHFVLLNFLYLMYATQKYSVNCKNQAINLFPTRVMISVFRIN